MKRKQYSVEQIVTTLKQAERGTAVTAPASLSAFFCERGG